MPSGMLPCPIPELRGKDVVFDMDGTLVDGDLGETVFFHLLIRNMYKTDCKDVVGSDGKEIVLSGSSAHTLHTYLSLIADGEMEKAYMYTARWIADLGEANSGDVTHEMLALARPPGLLAITLCQKCQTSTLQLPYGARIKPFMAGLVRQLLDTGVTVWIVSASPQPICTAAGQLLGVHPDNIIGVQTQGEHKRTPWGRFKVDELKKAGVSRPAVAVGDSAGDFDLLTFARHGILVNNTGDPELLQQAHHQGWFVLNDRPTEVNQ